MDVKAGLDLRENVRGEHGGSKYREHFKEIVYERNQRNRAAGVKVLPRVH